MDCRSYETYFAQKLLPNMPPQSVVAVGSASHHSRKRKSCQQSLEKRIKYESDLRCTMYHMKRMYLRRIK
jgi:hypothetical protein